MMTFPRPSLRSLAVALLAAVVGVLAVACGQTPTNPATGGSGRHVLGDNLTAYASCIRSHGLPNFPDPTPGSPQNGQSIGFSVGGQSFSVNLSGTGIQPSSQAFLSAKEACRGKLGQRGPIATPAAAAQLNKSAVKFAACMRQNGFPTFPDPTFYKQGVLPPKRSLGSNGHSSVITIVGAGGGISFNLQGIDRQSAQFHRASQKCGADLQVPQSSATIGG